MSKPITLAQLAQHINAQLVGDSQLVVSKVASLGENDLGAVTFLSNAKYAEQLENTQAAVVILKEADAQGYSGNKLICSNPYYAYALAAQLLDPTPAIAQQISNKADIHPTAVVAKTANIAAFAVISANAVIGEHCQIGSGVFVGENVHLGAHTKIYANAAIYHDVQIGERCIIHSNATVGSDGFGFANHQSQWIKIPQVGRVIVGNDVEIGANTAIDRGALKDTQIANGVKIDNLVHLAHNVEIGENSAIAANTAIAGSTKVGKRCTFAGCVAVNGHIDIGDDVHFTGTSMVTQSFPDAGVYSSGIPAADNKQWRKNTVRLKNIESLYDRIKALENEIKELKK